MRLALPQRLVIPLVLPQGAGWCCKRVRRCKCWAAAGALQAASVAASVRESKPEDPERKEKESKRDKKPNRQSVKHRGDLRLSPPPVCEVRDQRKAGQPRSVALARSLGRKDSAMSEPAPPHPCLVEPDSEDIARTLMCR